VASALKTRIQADLNASRKERDKLRTLVLSTVLSDMRNKEIDQRSELSDDDALQVIVKAIKLRNDASSQMRAGGRGELADKEDAQAEVLSAYLPEGLDEDEVRALVRGLIESGNDQMGPLMGLVMAEIRGRFDGKEASRIVREELQAP
jgi:uncharacterized protein YqeY